MKTQIYYWTSLPHLNKATIQFSGVTDGCVELTITYTAKEVLSGMTRPPLVGDLFEQLDTVWKITEKRFGTKIIALEVTHPDHSTK